MDHGEFDGRDVMTRNDKTLCDGRDVMKRNDKTLYLRLFL